MFDGQFSYFLLLLFFFWVIEAIAKARQRGRHPEQTPDETGTQPMPTTVERTEAEQPRAPLERPRNVWEEIAEIARQQSEQKRAEPGRRAPPSGTEAHGAKHEPPRRPVPAGRRPTPARPSEFPPPTPAHAHGAPSRWEEGIGREAARAAAAAEGAAADERRSERWLAGSSGEGAAAEATGAEASGPGELSRFEQADTVRRQTDPLSKRPAYQPAPPTPSTQRADAPRRPIHGRRATPAAAAAAARRLAAGPGRQVGTSVGTTERTSLSVHGLRGASRAELRRLLILQEVLGPPVALREGPLAEPHTP